MAIFVSQLRRRDV